MVKVRTHFLRDLIFDDISDEIAEVWEVKDIGEWIDEGKDGSAVLIIHNKKTDKFYETYLTRTGDHWSGHEVEEYDEDRKLIEVEQKEVTVTKWVKVEST